MVLQSRVEQPDWWGGGALCARFPLPTNHEYKKDGWFYEEQAAAAVCNGTSGGVVCPMRAECLHSALVNNECYGVWGGFLPDQRKWIRKKRRALGDSRIGVEQWPDSENWRHLVPSIDDIWEITGGSSKEYDEEEDS